jgi:hypothetical protein
VVQDFVPDPPVELPPIVVPPILQQIVMIPAVVQDAVTIPAIVQKIVAIPPPVIPAVVQDVVAIPAATMLSVALLIGAALPIGVLAASRQIPMRTTTRAQFNQSGASTRTQMNNFVAEWQEWLPQWLRDLLKDPQTRGLLLGGAGAFVGAAITLAIIAVIIALVGGPLTLAVIIVGVVILLLATLIGAAVGWLASVSGVDDPYVLFLIGFFIGVTAVILLVLVAFFSWSTIMALFAGISIFLATLARWLLQRISQLWNWFGRHIIRPIIDRLISLRNALLHFWQWYWREHVVDWLIDLIAYIIAISVNGLVRDEWPSLEEIVIYIIASFLAEAIAADKGRLLRAIKVLVETLKNLAALVALLGDELMRRLGKWVEDLQQKRSPQPSLPSPTETPSSHEP